MKKIFIAGAVATTLMFTSMTVLRQFIKLPLRNLVPSKKVDYNSK